MNKTQKNGFTLIEMIGVLAIIAILVSAVAPRIFEAIQDSKVTTVGTFVKTVDGAISQYYKDMGTTMPLADVSANSAVIDANGSYVTSGQNVNNALETALTHSKNANQVSGKWQNFNGPYLDKFERENPPIGTFMTLYTNTADNSGNAASANTPRNFDLNNDGTNDIPNNTAVVVLRIDEVSEKQWSKIENILDTKSDNLTTDQRKARGKVKMDGDEIFILVKY